MKRPIIDKTSFLRKTSRSSILPWLAPNAVIVISLMCASVSAVAGGWSFKWSDEFDRTGSPILPDTWRWSPDKYSVRDAQFNEANAFCEGGLLVLEARRVGAHKYTTAAINSYGLKSWKYGRFEMRGRIDIRPGSWPAWWTLGVSGGWPAGGELDIMEGFRRLTACAVHRASSTGSHVFTPRKIEVDDAWAKEFHTWTMEWNSSWIDMGVDGVTMEHYNVDDANGSMPDGGNPFRQPHYMLLNLAVGGTSRSPSKTQFPIRFEVDYVRYWEWVDSPGFEVNVTGGTGSGQYVPGTKVSITAKMAPAGSSFDKWVITSGDAAIAAFTNAATTFTMPSTNVTVTATYK